MSTYKIVFLVVIAAVGVFIAAIVASMFADKQALPNGYEISVGGKGEIWVQSRAHQALVTDVASVWSSPQRMLVERRTVSDKPPYGDRDCEYLATDAGGVLHPASKAEARAMVGGMTRQTGSSRSCLN